MKKIICISMAFVLVVVLMCSFVSCGASKEDIVGTWEGEWVYNYNKCRMKIEATATGRFEMRSWRNGILTEIQYGYFETQGDEVHFLFDYNSSYQFSPLSARKEIFEYSHGNLIKHNSDNGLTITLSKTE